jgi:hypothetical protein
MDNVIIHTFGFKESFYRVHGPAPLPDANNTALREKKNKEALPKIEKEKNTARRIRT